MSGIKLPQTSMKEVEDLSLSMKETEVESDHSSCTDDESNNDDNLSEYEQQRLLRIAENKRKLSDLFQGDELSLLPKAKVLVIA